MEENKIQLQSIWGKWWEPIRKWFYPAWLVYETSIRFYDYALSVHHYFKTQQDFLSAYIGEIGAQILNAFFSFSTFAICSAFLTIPASIALYQYFQVAKATNSPLESKLKTIF